MRLKQAFKYQLCSSLKAVGIYYSIMIAIRLAMVVIFVISSNQKANISAMESNSMIFMGFLGVYSILEDFKFFLQNGYSRKSLIKLYTCQFLVVGAIISVVEIILAVLSANVMNYSSLFVQIYGSQSLLTQFLWLWGIYCIIGALALLFTVINFRLSKFSRIIIFIAIPIALVTLAPAIDHYLMHGVIMSTLFDIILHFFGLHGSVNILAPILNFTIVFIIVCGLAYIAIRKMPVFK